MKCNFPKPCIYYREIRDESKSPLVEITCDYFEKEEYKRMSYQEKKNCKHFKNYKQLKY